MVRHTRTQKRSTQKRSTQKRSTRRRSAQRGAQRGGELEDSNLVPGTTFFRYTPGAQVPRVRPGRIRKFKIYSAPADPTLPFVVRDISSPMHESMEMLQMLPMTKSQLLSTNVDKQLATLSSAHPDAEIVVAANRRGGSRKYRK